MLEQNQNLNPNLMPVTDATVSVEEVASIQPKRKWWLYAVPVLALILLGSGGWWYYAKGQVMLLAKDMTWQWTGNYKISQNLDLKFDNIQGDVNSGLGLTNVGLNFSSFMDIVGQNLEGQADFSFSSNKESGDFILKYKKIDKTVYLGVDTQNELLKSIPFDFNNSWISIDQTTLQSGLFLKGKSDAYLSSVKDSGLKFDNFLNTAKEKKFIILSDPHETKEVASVKLKKMDFKVHPDKVNEFLLASIDAFVDEDTAAEMKKNFESYKTNKADNWSNMQDLIKALSFSFWVDAKSKNIQGMDFALDNFDLKNKNEHVLNLTFNFSQTLEGIETKVISLPENVVGLEELQAMIFSGFDSSSSDGLGSFTMEQLSGLGVGINNAIQTCSQAKKKINAPGKEGVQICDLEGVVDWPYLPSGYQWSKHFVSDGLSFNACFFSQSLPGITCTESGCMAGACQENITDCEGLGATECIDNQADFDRDGLTNIDETLLYKTDPNNPDTDGDTYSDGDEVKNGYNPSGVGKL